MIQTKIYNVQASLRASHNKARNNKAPIRLKTITQTALRKIGKLIQEMEPKP